MRKTSSVEQHPFTNLKDAQKMGGTVKLACPEPVEGLGCDIEIVMPDTGDWYVLPTGRLYLSQIQQDNQKEYNR